MPRTEARALRYFRYRANLAQIGSIARNETTGCGELSGERPIRRNGNVGVPAGTRVYPALIVACVVTLAGCGLLGGAETTPTPTPVPEASSPAGGAASSAASGAAVDTGLGQGQAESTEDMPFKLNTDQPVPPDFEEAYGRGARIVVQFYKLDEDSLSYPQGLDVDRQVNRSMERLSGRYPTIEFFSYQITDPGKVDDESLKPGQYGTLAAQLGVGITPFVAMLAPNGDEYAITNLYQGYVPEPVLSQALFDLAAVQVEDNTSDVNVRLDQVQTNDGGGIEYFTVTNGSKEPVNLNGFELRVLDPESADVDPDQPGVTVNSDLKVEPGETVSVGRVPDVKDDKGDQVDGTFEGGSELNLAPGDQVALLDSGGAVASTITV
jgi:hypothetical protein